MKIAIPVERMEGRQSGVSDHFGHAPFFFVADTKTGVEQFFDADAVREAGECAPLQALVQAGCQTILCRHMGHGALARCVGAGLSVRKTDAATAGEALDGFAEEGCPAIGEDDLCGAGGCGHEH